MLQQRTKELRRRREEEEDNEGEEEGEEEEEEGYTLHFDGNMDPLGFVQEDNHGVELYQQFEGLEYEALAERKRKALHEQEQHGESVKKPRREEILGLTMEEINELMNFGLGRRSRTMAEEKSKILIIGGTGYIGKFVVAASAHSGHPPWRTSRPPVSSPPTKCLLTVASFFSFSLFSSSSSPSFSSFFFSLSTSLGDLYDHKSRVKAIKQVDMIIFTMEFMLPLIQGLLFLIGYG